MKIELKRKMSDYDNSSDEGRSRNGLAKIASSSSLDRDLMNDLPNFMINPPALSDYHHPSQLKTPRGKMSINSGSGILGLPVERRHPK